MKDFNFFEEKGYKELQNIRHVYIIAVIIGIIVVFCSSFFIKNLIIEIKLKKDITLNEKYLNDADIKKKAAEYDDLAKKNQILTKYSDTITSLNKDMDSVNVVESLKIEKISSQVPEKVSFLSMTMDSKNININCKADDRTSIAEFEHNLKSIDFIDNVSISSIGSSEDNKFTFSVKCSVKDE